MDVTLKTLVEKLDGLLTPDKLRHELRSWQAELVRGVRFRSPATKATVTGATWSVASDGSPTDKATLGPERGLAWSVLSVAVSGPPIVAADVFTVWRNLQSPTNLFAKNVTGLVLQPGTLVLTPDEYLTLAGAATGVAGEAWVSLSIVEAPVELIWRLLG